MSLQDEIKTGLQLADSYEPLLMEIFRFKRNDKANDLSAAEPSLDNLDEPAVRYLEKD